MTRIKMALRFGLAIFLITFVAIAMELCTINDVGFAWASVLPVALKSLKGALLIGLGAAIFEYMGTGLRSARKGGRYL